MQAAILARHGESDFSARALVNGDVAAACPLTERGRGEARRLGDLLTAEAIDLCAVTELERTRETADVALEGRDVPRLVVPELNDPLYGAFEGGTLEEYRGWAWSHGSREEAPGGGESRLAIVGRYVHGFRLLLERPEHTVLVVTHALPIAYVLAALDGRDPGPRVDLVDHARPYRVPAADLLAAVERLEAWCAAPSW